MGKYLELKKMDFENVCMSARFYTFTLVFSVCAKRYFESYN